MRILRHGKLKLYQAVDPTLNQANWDQLGRESEIIGFFSDLYGQYPFSSGGGVVDDAFVFYALESQTKSMYDRTASPGTVVHEIAHQWFGNAVTLTVWPDLWLNEGFARFSEWIYNERHGGETAPAAFERVYARAPTHPTWSFPAAAPPTAASLFGTPPYDRGGMTLQALRVKVGTRSSSTSCAAGTARTATATSRPRTSSRSPSARAAWSWTSSSGSGCTRPAGRRPGAGDEEVAPHRSGASAGTNWTPPPAPDQYGWPMPGADTMTTSYWHPFADMGAVSQAELLIERGEGVHVFDADGTRYLDGTASLWYANLGHGRADVTRAVAEQMDKLAAYSTFGDFSNPPANELAARLAALAPMDDAKVFLGSGGGDAIDTAAKIARRHWVLQGQPERVHIISRTNGYHGTHAFGTSIGGIEANVSNWGPLIPHTSAVPFDSLPALEQEILRIGPDRVAAFFCEPVIGAGGVHLPPEGYIDGVADLCAEHGVLLVIDSVICAFGRLGTWFGIERWPEVRPDMITFAKGVTSGYLPLGGVIVAGAVAAPFFSGPGGPMLRHGATYAGHPTCCAAALAVLDAYEAEDLTPRGRELEEPLRDALAPLADHDAVGEVRAGLGLLGAVQLSDDALAADPAAVGKVAAGARAAGVLVRPLLRGVALSPPLIVDSSHLEEMAAAIRAGLERL